MLVTESVYPRDPQFLTANNVYLRRALILPDEMPKMPDEELIKILKDGGKMKFIYKKLPDNERHEVVYSVLLH